MSNKLNSRWTADCTTPEERKIRYGELVGGFNLFDLIREVITDHRDEVESRKNALPKYEEAAWPFRQAHFNGQIEAIDNLLDILPNEEVLKELSKKIN